MPQMSPMYWTIMMLLTMMMYLQINSMIFFNQTNLKMKNNKKTSKKNIWKW